MSRDLHMPETVRLVTIDWKGREWDFVPSVEQLQSMEGRLGRFGAA